MRRALGFAAAALVAAAVGVSQLSPTVRSALQWLERGQRLPQLALTPPRRTSLELPGARVDRLEVRIGAVEERALPPASVVTALADDGHTLWIGTLNDGLFATTSAGAQHREDVDARINDLALGEGGALYAATNGGAYELRPGHPARLLGAGAFTATAFWKGAPWFVSRRGLSTIDGAGLWTRGPGQGFGFDTAAVLASCGEALCIGAMDGLWRFDGARLSHDSSANRALPTDWVTAVSHGAGRTWVGTFDAGLAALPGDVRLTPSGGLADGRVLPHALAHVDGLVVAGTPSGALVVRGRQAGHVRFDRDVAAVIAAKHGGAWLGHRGGATRVRIELPAFVAEVR